ncbi:MAG: chlorite dismutase [Acidimicrobiia bacterium]
MSDEALFAHYVAFRRVSIPRRNEALWVGEGSLPPVASGDLGTVLPEVLAKSDGSVELRGSYNCEGFRPDVDLLLWMTSRSVEALQSTYVSLRKTFTGAALEPSHIFLGVVRPPEFNPDHMPAFAKGEPPRRYICVYPFVRTAEWYLMDSARRAELLREHGQMGREFPEVLTNTTSGFGLGDWEWILAFESDDLIKIVDCIRRLRDAEARRFTKLDTPFVVGIRKPLEQILEEVG